MPKNGWLDAHPGIPKLLLLLDEADQFLTFDATPSGELTPRERSGFQRVTKLKGLMDRTNRRFKVVFMPTIRTTSSAPPD